MAYSTIRVKMGYCELCPESKGKQALTKKLCNIHYWQAVKMRSAHKSEELEQEDRFGDVVADLDAIFSRYIRLKDADKEGMATCVTCGKKDNHTSMQCGHFISRQHMYTRFCELNCHVQCEDCNVRLRGNLARYAKYLESTNRGSVDLLMEQGHTVYKYSITELKEMIAHYTQRIKLLSK